MNACIFALICHAKCTLTSEFHSGEISTCATVLFCQLANLIFFVVDYVHLWLVWFCCIFRNYLTSSTIFQNMYVIWNVCFSSVAFLLGRRIHRDIINVSCLHVKCLIFLSDFKQISIFLADFNERIQYEISRKPVQWEPSCSMLTDTVATILYRSTLCRRYRITRNTKVRHV
jgi:hypothetical protein